ncbi:Glutathione S-transferase, C-terminal domain [Methylophaga sulfidovorans]|uniref:Glutathione S-transferase, C-terminal domain n=2 Tax=Methylophaga sulfidovorans TaxID=45496 RepID=A0A1I3UDZ3_9GAMM|nr:Glutathione S-transferase, C-terminal domain [Methylophaga sulfidovorans]
MGLFSRKKDKGSNNLELLGLKGQVSTMKCLLMAGIRDVPLKTTLASSEVAVDQVNSYQYLETSDKVPNLTQGDFSVSGVRAILTYIDVKGKGVSLIPKKARNLGLQNYWIDVCYQTFGPATQAFINNSMTEKDTATLSDVLKSLEKILAENEFIVGQLSFADPHVAAYIYVLRVGGYDLTDYPNIGKWISRLEGKMSGSLNIEGFQADMQSGASQVA